MQKKRILLGLTETMLTSYEKNRSRNVRRETVISKSGDGTCANEALVCEHSSLVEESGNVVVLDLELDHSTRLCIHEYCAIMTRLKRK